MKKLLLLLLLIPNLVMADLESFHANRYKFDFSKLELCENFTQSSECFGRIEFENGAVFEGEMQTGTNYYARKGTITWSNGTILKITADWDGFVSKALLISGGETTLIDLSSFDYQVAKVQPSFENGKLVETPPPINPIQLDFKLATGLYLPPDLYTGGGYDPKNEQESNKPDVDERKDPPKTYRAQNDNELLPAASGSGFAISKDGYILTNNHVVNGCQALNIHTNGKLVSARLIASDPINDLALIKGSFKPQTVFYINPSTPKLLDDIYVAGYPFGYAISSSIKITNGIVSSLSGLGDNFSQMQITNAIQPGNSGGPVVDKKGNVVGIAVAKLNMQAVFEDYGVIPENTNFAIKSSTAKSFAESNNIRLISKSPYKNKELGEYISNGTYYLSCMMTMARIKEMKTEKVFFKNIIK